MCTSMKMPWTPLDTQERMGAPVESPQGLLCWLLRQTLDMGEEAQTHGDIRDEMPVRWSCERVFSIVGA